MKTFQRPLNGQGWDVVSTCKVRGLRADRPSWLWAQSHPRAREQAGQRDGGGCQKSSQLLFHFLTLLDGPLGTQATPPFSVTGSSFHPGGTPPTAHAVTGRPTAFPGSPPCPTSSGEEESLEIKQASTQSQPHPKV